MIVRASAFVLGADSDRNPAITSAMVIVGFAGDRHAAQRRADVSPSRMAPGPRRKRPAMAAASRAVAKIASFGERGFPITHAGPNVVMRQADRDERQPPRKFQRCSGGSPEQEGQPRTLFERITAARAAATRRAIASAASASNPRKHNAAGRRSASRATRRNISSIGNELASRRSRSMTTSGGGGGEHTPIRPVPARRRPADSTGGREDARRRFATVQLALAGTQDLPLDRRVLQRPGRGRHRHHQPRDGVETGIDPAAAEERVHDAIIGGELQRNERDRVALLAHSGADARPHQRPLGIEEHTRRHTCSSGLSHSRSSSRPTVGRVLPDATLEARVRAS